MNRLAGGVNRRARSAESKWPRKVMGCGATPPLGALGEHAGFILLVVTVQTLHSTGGGLGETRPTWSS